jgi:hypothetical protein
MRTYRIVLWIGALLLVFSSGALATSFGTAFFYQGRLSDGTIPANGNYDFEFSLYDAATNGNQINGTVDIPEIRVANGSFSTAIDFGPEAFTGKACWLEIAVRKTPLILPNKTLYTTLSPRCAVLPLPYALCAGDLNSSDAGPLELKINGVRGWRLESISLTKGTVEHDYSVNVVGGYGNNSVVNGVMGATIAGGGYSYSILINKYSHPNTVTGDHGTVGGGHDNTAGFEGTVPGGAGNTASGKGSFAAGRQAQAIHDGVFVWNDGIKPASSTASNRFEVYANGGANFYTGSQALYTSGLLSCSALKIRGGADLAEPFALSDFSIPVGAIVVIDPDNPGHLKESDQEYDRKVAGIISGAGGVQAGISMNQNSVFESGQNVALTGRVYALADATFGEITPGDLLTTSDTPGHARKVTDFEKAHGAVLGKAMTGLRQGKGLILVLVSLQ